MGMRICLIARNRFHGDRRALATHRVLTRAGHDVVVVAVDEGLPRDPVVATVPRRSGAPGPLAQRITRLLPQAAQDRILSSRLAAAAADLGADVYLPLHEDVLGVAVMAAQRVGAVVQRRPGMAEAGAVDLMVLAPSNPELARPTGGFGSSFTRMGDATPYEPVPDRYAGERVVICFRKTDSNPGRYLESALRRAGFDVRLETDDIDLDTVDPSTRFVVFVEGPYPAIDVTGNTEVPSLFWVHHGEHHLFSNLRLTDRYQADAVLLAHSWHLAHWFPTPVHRFPFAIPPEMFPHRTPLARREFDIAMVGSRLREEAWQYRRRTELVADLESHLGPDRVRFVEGVAPEVMAEIYADSRIVLNEGGTRHHPITMRVFEAVGAGAILLTDTPPGLDLLFESEREYAVLRDDARNAVDRLLGDLEQGQAVADRAFERAMGTHTYDHRVDLLVEIAKETPKREVSSSPPGGELATAIDADVEVQRVVHDGVPGLDEELPDREVWPLSERTGRLSPGSMDAAVITADTISGLETLLDSARRYVYALGSVTGLDEYLETRYPEAVTYQNGDVRRIDLMTEGYRVKSAGSNQ